MAIGLFRVHPLGNVGKIVQDVWDSGFIGQGPKNDEFERGLESFLGARANSVLTLNSCTSALHLALHLSGVTYGRTAISTPMTCMATNEPIVNLGGNIVWCDIHYTTGNLDHTKLSRLLAENPECKAVVCVAWAGYPCEFDELHAICREHGAKLIVDAAHGFGMEYHGERVFGDFTCFSFQAIKHISTGDGGALWCADPDDYDRGYKLRWYGMDRRSPKTAMRCEDPVTECGYKFHMNDINAAIGSEQLHHASSIIARHRANAEAYDRAIPLVHSAGGVTRLNYRHDDRKPAYWIYSCLHPRRDEIVAYLNEQGIGASAVHKRCDTHPCFDQYRTHLPGVEIFDARQFAIPCGWWLTEQDRNFIIEHVTHAHERIEANVR